MKVNSKRITRRSFIGTTGAVASMLTILAELVISRLKPQGIPGDPVASVSEVRDGT